MKEEGVTPHIRKAGHITAQTLNLWSSLSLFWNLLALSSSQLPSWLQVSSQQHRALHFSLFMFSEQKTKTLPQLWTISFSLIWSTGVPGLPNGPVVAREPSGMNCPIPGSRDNDQQRRWGGKDWLRPIKTHPWNERLNKPPLSYKAELGTEVEYQEENKDFVRKEEREWMWVNNWQCLP